MTDFADVKVALRSQNCEYIKDIVTAYLQTENASVERILSQFFYLAAHEDISTGEPLGLVYMDSIRDLLTLYEAPDADPSVLLDSAIDYFCTLALRELDKSLTTLQPEDMGQILMVEDLGKHIRAGHRDKALRQTTNLLWTMDNVFYLVEILTELAVSVDNQGDFPLILSGAVLKTTDFVTSAQRNPLVFLLTEYLTTQDFTSDPAAAGENDPPTIFAAYYTSIIDASDVFSSDLIYLTYAHQIWEAVRMKAESIQPLILRALSNRFESPEKKKHQAVKPVHGDITGILDALRVDDSEKSRALLFGYVKAGKGLGTLYRHLADLAFNYLSPEDPMDLILLNAYRTALTYVEPPLQNHLLVRAGDLVRAIIRKG